MGTIVGARPVPPRDPRGEAAAVAGPGWAPRVLEPSPPAVAEEPWFADDPPAPGPPEPGRASLLPVPGGPGATWDDFCRERPGLRAWCAERWLGAWRELPPPPPGLEATRLAVHRLAVYVVSPWRRQRTGRIGLRWTLGGLGTPFTAPGDAQVRIVRDGLVAQGDGRARLIPFGSLAAAAAALGVALDLGAADRFDVPPPGDLDAPLWIDPAGVDLLGEWFGLAASALEALRAEAGPGDDPGRPQLWPEHLDLAVDLGAGAARATFGASPGDAHHPEPYLYVLPAQAPAGDPFWDAPGFRGRLLGLGDLRAAPGHRGAGLAFLRGCRDRLRAAAEPPEAGLTPP